MNAKKAKQMRKSLKVHFDAKVPTEYADTMRKGGIYPDELVKRTLKTGTFRSAVAAFKKEFRAQHIGIRFR